MSLPRETNPVVETWLRIVQAPRCRCRLAHVPFTDECRVIAGHLQVLRKENAVRIGGRVVIYDPMVVHVLPGQYRRPAW